MIVHVKLYASLRRYRPGLALGESFACSAPDDTTVGRLFSEVLGLPAAEVAIALVNGMRSDWERRLNNGDTVALWPPIAGGVAGGNFPATFDL
jgi:molybdopterin converting factor small subunit